MPSRISITGRYLHTIRYLRPIQVYGRLLYRFRKPTIDLSPPPECREVAAVWVIPAKRTKKMLTPNTFRFLNEVRTIEGPGDWNSENSLLLWLYNLHYFDDLNADAANERKGWHQELMTRWIRENPPPFGVAWDPYPTSLRAVNWIKWDLSGQKLSQEVKHSLAVQARLLVSRLEIHLLGNHLFANAKALVFAGLYFDGDEADIWYKTGLNIIRRELPEQVLNDGGNFELSPMYHAIFLEDLLDVVNLHRTYDRELPDGIEQVIPKMLCWLTTMCHPDGEISFFNDAAIGVTPSVEELLMYARRLGFEIPRPDLGLTELPDSGYSRIEKDDVVVLVDCAAIGPDYLPAHAHADTLSFELSLFGRRVIVNSGTSVYGSGAERQRQRSTSAHSTIVIDNEDSSEVWGGFRVARRAKVDFSYVSQREGIMVTGCHDGYKRLHGRPVHCRTWHYINSSLNIYDEIKGRGRYKSEMIFHLHPDVEVENISDNRVVLRVAGRSIEVAYSGDGRLYVERSTYHPEFGLTVNSKKLVYCVRRSLPINIATRITWPTENENNWI